MSNSCRDKEGETSHELGLFPDVNQNPADGFHMHSMKDKGFEYKKSIFATIFAITLAMAIIFTILYTRCSTNYIMNESECNKCHINAHCFHLKHNVKRCECKPGFIGDGKSTCNGFLENFFTPISPDMLLSKTLLTLPEAREMTICLRYKIISFSENETLTLTQSFVKNRKKPILALYKTYNAFVVTVEDSKLTVSVGQEYMNRPEHICFMFNTTGTWKVFLNGEFYSSGISRHMRRLHRSEVNVSIGETPSQAKTSKMRISELMIFSKMINSKEIYNIEKLMVNNKDVIISWDQFNEGFMDTK